MNNVTAMPTTKDKPPIPDELVIELAKPITLSNGKDDEQVFTQIELHEPNVSQLSQFVKKVQRETAVDAMKFLISMVSGMPQPVLDKVGVSDFYRAMDYMRHWVEPPEEDDPMGNAEGSR